MKYLFYPIFRVIGFLLAVFIALPLFALFQCMASLWEWDMKYIEEINEFFTNFHSEEKPYYNGDKYYSYPSPIDFLLDRKVWLVQEDGYEFKEDE